MCNFYNINGDPFSKLSAEKELDVLNEIYFKPKRSKSGIRAVTENHAAIHRLYEENFNN